MVSSSPWLSDGAREIESYPAYDLRFDEFLCGLWVTACTALGVPTAEAVRTSRVLRAALPSWAGEWIGTAPVRPSYVAEDGFPAEMSVNWSGTRPELRVLFDCLGDTAEEPGPISVAEPGDPRFGRAAVTRRWGEIHELFTPGAGRPSEAPLWHSVAWRPPSRPVHKTYFGLYTWPSADRYAAVAAAMRRLGMAEAWDRARTSIESVAGQREIEFFAVDLAEHADARVKIYYRSHGADIAEVNRIASVARNHDSASALTAFRALAGDRPDAGEAALSCLAFRSGLDQAAECSTYLRLADLAGDDAEAVDRTAGLLRREGVDPDGVRALAFALAEEPLERSRGLLELVSYRAAGRRADVTTYFRPPVYARRTADPLTPVDLE